MLFCQQYSTGTCVTWLQLADTPLTTSATREPRARAQEKTLGRAVQLTDSPLLRYNPLRTVQPQRSLAFPVAVLNLQRLTGSHARLSSTTDYVAAFTCSIRTHGLTRAASILNR